MAAEDSADERRRIAQMDSCTICRGDRATACAAASESGDGESAAVAAPMRSAASADAAGSCGGEGVDASPRGDAAPGRCAQCIEHGLAFNASYTIPAVASAMIRCFTARGLRRSLVRDNSCVVQWAPFTKIAWPRVLNGSLLASCYYIHAGLVNKRLLYKVLCTPPHEPPHSHAHLVKLAHDAAPASFDVPGTTASSGSDTSTPGSALGELRRQVLAIGGTWVLKEANTNNALQVHVFASDALDDALAAHVGGKREEDDSRSDVPRRGKRAETAWVLQQYVANPLLVRGCKFHIRVNVLARGDLQVFVHDDMVIHVACEAYSAGDWGNRWRHITNHGVQRDHAAFDAKRNTLSLSALRLELVEAALGRCEAGDVTAQRAACAAVDEQCDRLPLAIRGVVAGTFARFATERKLFWPMASCFEVFGFDFLVDADWKVWLLEINECPALEGVANPALCADVVEDVLQLAVDPVLGLTTPPRSENACPRDNGFSLVLDFPGGVPRPSAKPAGDTPAAAAPAPHSEDTTAGGGASRSSETGQARPTGVPAFVEQAWAVVHARHADD